MKQAFAKNRICVTLLLLACLLPPLAQAKNPSAIINGNKVKLEVASSPQEIQRGLMYRTSLAEDAGMVFVFSPAQAVKFWMCHTLIPLDMIFVKNGTVVRIFENVPPCKSEDCRDCVTYPAIGESDIFVDEVIEVNAGYAKRHKISAGDSVTFELPGKH